MSLHSAPIPPVPDETARVARAAFPRGNVLMHMRDALGTIYRDEQFADLFPVRGQPAEAPWRLALVTVFQFMERLPDRQAADAVRSRLDWKYALSLELTDPGFDHTVLSEFRSRLVSYGAEERLLDVMLELFTGRGWLKARGRARTDSTHVLAKVRALNRVELVGETLRAALNALAIVVPDWLRAHAPPEWAERYNGRAEDDRLPAKKAECEALVQQIGADGAALLAAIGAGDAPSWLREVPAVEVLRQVWLQNYVPSEQGPRWRTQEDGLPPSAEFVSSPYDTDAHYARKRTTSWVGYKVHLTETCDDDSPHLITHVQTTPGPTADGVVTPCVHQHLAARGLLPAVHVVDTGFLDAELLVTSQRDFAVQLLGPTRRDRRWQARANAGFGMEHFQVDWEAQRARCPQGRTSTEWFPHLDTRGNAVITIRFSLADCGPCPVRALCTQSAVKYPRRSITVRPHAQYEALQHRRREEATPAYAREYARRAGIEGTLSEGVRAHGMRRSRYIGLQRTHLAHLLTAAAVNLVHVGAWLSDTPRAQTRQSRFVRLMTQPHAA
jgi:transposase